MVSQLLLAGSTSLVMAKWFGDIMRCPLKVSNTRMSRVKPKWENTGSNDHALIQGSVFVCRVIMVMVWGQILSGEIVVTSWSSKDISYRSTNSERIQI